MFHLLALGQGHLASAVFVAFGLPNSTAGLVGILVEQFADTLWAITGFCQTTRPPVSLCLLIASAKFLIVNLIRQSGLLEPVESLVA